MSRTPAAAPAGGRRLPPLTAASSPGSPALCGRGAPNLFATIAESDGRKFGDDGEPRGRHGAE
jgi:hypothetical protein